MRILGPLPPLSHAGRVHRQKLSTRAVPAQWGRTFGQEARLIVRRIGVASA
jgi:hypothetical protein